MKSLRRWSRVVGAIPGSPDNNTGKRDGRPGVSWPVSQATLSDAPNSDAPSGYMRFGMWLLSAHSTLLTCDPTSAMKR